MQTSIPGSGDGSCSGGKIERHRKEDSIHGNFRPYLHMYAHSNELEEKGVVNLNAVNVERNPDMEMLLGVSRWVFAHRGVLTVSLRAEKVHVHAVHRVKLVRPCGA